MNTLKNKFTKLIKLTLISSLLLTVSGVFANNPIKVDVVSSDSAKVTNVSTRMSNNMLSISGKLKHVAGGHRVIPGKVKIELIDSEGKVLKIVKTKHRRHAHHTNKAYKFSAHVNVDSLDVRTVRVMHDK